VNSAEERLKKVLNKLKKLEGKLSEDQREKNNLDKELAKVIVCILYGKYSKKRMSMFLEIAPCNC